MDERIKELRKKLKLTQQTFADKLSIKRGAVANYEIGRNIPADSVIALICREFNVNEDWLRTGTGEMFIKPDTFSLDNYMKSREATEWEVEFVKAYFDLDVPTRRKLMKHFRERLLNVPFEYDLSDSAAQNPEQPLISGDKNIEESPGISQPGGGFSRADFDAMTPEEIADIIRNQRELEKNKQARKVVPAGTDQAVDG